MNKVLELVQKLREENTQKIRTIVSEHEDLGDKEIAEIEELTDINMDCISLITLILEKAKIKAKKQLDKLVSDGTLLDFQLTDNMVVLRYALSSVEETEIAVELKDYDLANGILESAKELGDDIMGCLVDENDFYGYNNKEELAERIEEETEFLRKIGERVSVWNIVTTEKF